MHRVPVGRDSVGLLGRSWALSVSCMAGRVPAQGKDMNSTQASAVALLGPGWRAGTVPRRGSGRADLRRCALPAARMGGQERHRHRTPPRPGVQIGHNAQRRPAGGRALGGDPPRRVSGNSPLGKNSYTRGGSRSLALACETFLPRGWGILSRLWTASGWGDQRHPGHPLAAVSGRSRAAQPCTASRWAGIAWASWGDPGPSLCPAWRAGHPQPGERHEQRPGVRCGPPGARMEGRDSTPVWSCARCAAIVWPVPRAWKRSAWPCTAPR